MAILKYKKLTNNNQYTIEEMPVISNLYTQFVTQGISDGVRNITLTPVNISGSTGPGAFENVIANVKLLNTTPEYDPQTSAYTITYGENGFPAQITINAIPTKTVTYTSSNSYQEYDFNTTTSFPSKVIINAIPSSGAQTITLNPDNLSDSLSAGYYDSISLSVKTIAQNPSYTPLTTQQTITYNSDTGFPKKVIIEAIPSKGNGTITLSSSKTSDSIEAGYYDSVFASVTTTSGPVVTITNNNYNSNSLIPAGFYNSAGRVTFNIQTLQESNIVNGKTILGVTGTYIGPDSTQNLIKLIDRTITRLDIPHGVETIGTYVFYNCNNLTYVTIPDSTTTIKSNAFQGCTSLEQVIFHGQPTSIASSAFQGDTNITDIYVPWSSGAVSNAKWGATNATIHYDAIEICYGQQLGDTTTYWYINGDTLYITGTGEPPSYSLSTNPPWYNQSSKIKNIVVGDKITKISASMFANHSNCENITIGAAVRTVEGMAFLNTKITTLSIPASVRNFDPSAVNYCSQLEKFIISSNSYYSTDDAGLLYNQSKTILYRCPENITGTVRIDTNVSTISANAFFNCKLTTFIMKLQSEGTHHIYRAFVNCDNLTKAVFYSIFSTGYTVIIDNGDIFSGCNNLTRVCVGWRSSDVAYAPWGATNATIVYEYHAAN